MSASCEDKNVGSKEMDPGSDSQPSVIVRRVKGYDYNAIMDIGDIYSLAEYLPHMFYQFLEDERCHMYVVEVNNEIVSFRAFHVPPEGRTVNAMAGRTKEKVRGRGYQKVLKDHAIKEICLKNPGIERLTFSAFYHKYWKTNLYQKIEQNGLALHRVWKVLVYCCERPLVESLPMVLLKSMETLPSPSQMSKQRLNNIIKQSDDVDDLLKKGGDFYVCWNNWMVLPVGKESIRLGLDIGNVFVSYSGTDARSHMTAISLSTWVPVTEHVRIDFYFYGDGLDVLYGHLRAQIETVMKESKFDKCVLEVHFSTCLDSTLVEKTLGHHLGKLYFYYPDNPTECIIVSECIDVNNT